MDGPNCLATADLRSRVESYDIPSQQRSVGTHVAENYADFGFRPRGYTSPYQQQSVPLSPTKIFLISSRQPRSDQGVQNRMQADMQNYNHGEELRFGQQAQGYVQGVVQNYNNWEEMNASHHQNLHTPRPYVPAPMPKYKNAENVQVEYHPAAAFYNQQHSWEFINYAAVDFQNPQTHYFYDRDCLNMAITA